jgi:hypothetical protein
LHETHCKFHHLGVRKRPNGGSAVQNSSHENVMPSVGHHLRLLAAALPLLAASMAGCSSTSTSSEVLTTERVRPAPADKYPDFSQPLDSAMPQMTDEEAARQEAQLSALSRQRQAGTISAAEYRRRVEALRLLGQQAEQ